MYTFQRVHLFVAYNENYNPIIAMRPKLQPNNCLEAKITTQ